MIRRNFFPSRLKVTVTSVLIFTAIFAGTYALLQGGFFVCKKEILVLCQGTGEANIEGLALKCEVKK